MVSSCVAELISSGPDTWPEREKTGLLDRERWLVHLFLVLPYQLFSPAVIVEEADRCPEARHGAQEAQAEGCRILRQALETPGQT